MEFTIVRDVKAPSIAHHGDAGIDFYIPQLTDRFIEEVLEKSKPCTGFYTRDNWNNHCIMVYPHQRVLIPSGVHVKIPSNQALIAHNKSGVAHKLGFDRMAEVVDSSYQGEIHISLCNTSRDNIILYSEMKIIQFVRVLIDTSSIKQVKTLEELYPEETSRASGGFGSTQNK